MSNLEELIRIRNESIKKQEEALEMIENAIKEYSTTFYNEYLNKMLKNDASSLSKSELTINLSSIYALSENTQRGLSYSTL